MEKNTRSNRPMALVGSKNTRDLGGYPTMDGINTINGAFLRSDKPSRFTKLDKASLYRYGVRLVVDLRSDSEVSQEPCVLVDYEDICVKRVPLLDNIQSDTSKSNMPSSLGELYIGLLENSKSSICEMFNIFADFLDSCTFFCCTAGKDRTGVTAMLLLKLAGVSDADVIADYSSTYTNIKEDADLMIAGAKEMGIEMPKFLMRSDSENMEMALKHLQDVYGSAQNYLLHIGVAENKIEALRFKKNKKNDR